MAGSEESLNRRDPQLDKGLSMLRALKIVAEGLLWGFSIALGWIAALALVGAAAA